MKKILSFLGCLLIYTSLFASSVAYEAKCPQDLVALEIQYWNEATDIETVRDFGRLIEVSCSVYKPALSNEDFQKMSMILPFFTLYPDVIRPWTLENDNLTIIRGLMTPDRIEIIKVIYNQSNGNLFFSRITLTPKAD